MENQSFELTLDLKDAYRFGVDFGMEGVPELLVDEPAPLGEGSGPNPARLLAAAVGNCLGASLLFCLRKAHVDVEGLTVQVRGEMRRNEKGRLRIAGLHATLAPELAAADSDRIGRCATLFEDFCIVTQSVKEGIDVTVEVAAPAASAAS